jgi:opine dehydrogenase
MTGPDPQTVAILGAGNGGCAAAADLGRRGYGVRLWSRREERLAPLREAGGIEYTGALGDGLQPIDTLTTEIATAMDGADLVLIMVPTHAHEAMARAVAPHLTGEQILMVSPGHTLLLVPQTLRACGIAQPVTCETGTLPYICRMDSPACVRVTQPSRHQAFAAFPANQTDRLATLIKPLFSMIQPVGSVLETVFPYTNAIHHPPAFLCNAGRVESTGGDYYHYYDGITPSVGRLIDRLDAERLAVAHALGCDPAPLPEHFLRMGYTTEAARDSGLAYEVFHQSEADRWIRAPATLEYRFFTEDVPYGLVPLSELGRLAGIDTPVIDAMIEICSALMDRDFRTQGLTLERVGLANTTPDALQLLLQDGF